VINIEKLKAEILEAMYRSVDRMNRHIIERSLDSATSEQRLQANLRKNFEGLSQRQEN